MKKHKTVLVVGSAVLLLSFVVSVLLYRIKIRPLTKRIACGSHLSCLHAFLNKEQGIPHEAIDTNLGKDWRMLNDNEYQIISTQWTKSDALDPGGLSDSAIQQLLDHWGNRILIAARKSGRGAEFMILSKGPDGKPNTKDDIVLPYGHTFPIEKLD